MHSLKSIYYHVGPVVSVPRVVAVGIGGFTQATAVRDLKHYNLDNL